MYFPQSNIDKDPEDADEGHGEVHQGEVEGVAGEHHKLAQAASDPSGFRVGDGVCLRAKNPHNGGTEVLKRTLVARSGKRFKLDRPLRQ